MRKTHGRFVFATQHFDLRESQALFKYALEADDA
jgi:hypothetical protein